MKKNILYIILIIIMIIAIILSIVIYLNSNYIEIRYVASSIGDAVVGWVPKEKSLSINRLGKYEYFDNNNSNSNEDYTIKSGNIEKNDLQEIESKIINTISSSTKIDSIDIISGGYFLEYKNKKFEISSEDFNNIIKAVNENWFNINSN